MIALVLCTLALGCRAHVAPQRPLPRLVVPAELRIRPRRWRRCGPVARVASG